MTPTTPGGDTPPPQEFTATVYNVEPETLNLQSKGDFTLFLEFPGGYLASDADPPTLGCSGAYAIQTNVCADHKLSAKFYRQDLLNVPTGNDVVLTVTGKLIDGTRFVAFASVRVINH